MRYLFARRLLKNGFSDRGALIVSPWVIPNDDFSLTSVETSEQDKYLRLSPKLDPLAMLCSRSVNDGAVVLTNLLGVILPFVVGRRFWLRH